MNQKPVAIITGAAGGIGAAIAEKFAKNNYAVALVDIDREKLEAIGKQFDSINHDYLLLHGDLSSHEFLSSIDQAVIQKWGRIDVLVNNAAWRTRETLRTITVTVWEKTIRVCLTAPAFLTRYVAAHMERLAIKGVIINISSIQSQLAGGASPAYTVCKGGIESLTYESSVLYGPKGLRVLAISPGNIATTISTDIKNDKEQNISERFNNEIISQTPLQRAGDADEVASLAYWLTTDEASFINGTNITVDGGYSHNFIPYHLKKSQLNKEF